MKNGRNGIEMLSGKAFVKPDGDNGKNWVTQNAPSATTHAEVFNGSLGLLNGSGSSYNATDAEANQEMAEMLRRKKKRKRGMRL